jgi:hypothetical protein
LRFQKIGEQEIDFIATRADKKIYIQVAYLLADEKTIEREFGALEKIGDNYPKYVLSMDKFYDRLKNGIKWINIIDFLVGEETP